jgi:protein TonB
MGYQALLFCLDEKLARVVTQVFSELDFTVEPVNEPFAAVKKLMSQRFDAIVVDCENEPNASLLFKSARNSNSNQNSLALALVEGQAGVAKAYRIGANLVLTKPLNVEQAKGTLRVARGLLRKNSDTAASGANAASSTAAAKAAAPPSSSFKPMSPSAEPAGRSMFESPEFESPLPAMAASAEVEDIPVAAPLPDAQTKISSEADSRVTDKQKFPAAEPAVPSVLPVQPAALPSSGSSHGPSSGAAAAPAPAKETPAPIEKKPAAQQEVGISSFGSATVGSSPSFAALDKEDADGSGGSKKVLIAAAVVLVVAALAYFGWTKLGQGNSGSHSISAPQKPVSSASPAPTPVSPATPSTNTSEPAVSASGSASAAPTAKPSATISISPLPKSSAEPEPATKKPVAPIVVKSSSAGKKAQAQSEDPLPQVPSPLAVATPNDKSLSGLISAGPTDLPKAPVSTLKISQGVSQGLLIKRVQPRYPQNALSMRVQGAVQLQATINQEGNIRNLKVLSGDPVLAHAATEAVRQWRYKPYYLNGQPVEIETQITVNFKLPN